MDHVVYLDELTMNLATAWIIERVERWPDSTNPNLSRQTAVDDLHPQVSNEVIRTSFDPAAVVLDR